MLQLLPHRHPVGMGGGYVNPQQYALQMAREQENAALAAGSTDRSKTSFQISPDPVIKMSMFCGSLKNSVSP